MNVLKRKAKPVKDKVGEVIKQIRSVKYFPRAFAIFFFLTYFFRRLLMALIIVQYYEDSARCIIAVIHINLLYTVTFLSLKPYRDKKENFNETFNDVSTLFISYILMLFSDEFV